MKAWHVQDIDGEMQEIIFAKTRSKAILQSEAYSHGGEYIEVRATRAKYADGMAREPREKLLEVMMGNGWWFECQECSGIITEEDESIIKSGSVFHEKCFKTRKGE